MLGRAVLEGRPGLRPIMQSPPRHELNVGLPEPVQARCRSGARAFPEDRASDVNPDRANSVFNKILPQVIDGPGAWCGFGSPSRARRARRLTLSSFAAQGLTSIGLVGPVLTGGVRPNSVANDGGGRSTAGTSPVLASRGSQRYKTVPLETAPVWLRRGKSRGDRPVFPKRAIDAGSRSDMLAVLPKTASAAGGAAH